MHDHIQRTTSDTQAVKVVMNVVNHVGNVAKNQHWKEPTYKMNRDHIVMVNQNERKRIRMITR